MPVGVPVEPADAVCTVAAKVTGVFSVADVGVAVGVTTTVSCWTFRLKLPVVLPGPKKLSVVST